MGNSTINLVFIAACAFIIAIMFYSIKDLDSSFADQNGNIFPSNGQIQFSPSDDREALSSDIESLNDTILIKSRYTLILFYLLFVVCIILIFLLLLQNITKYSQEKKSQVRKTYPNITVKAKSKNIRITN